LFFIYFLLFCCYQSVMFFVDFFLITFSKILLFMIFLSIIFASAFRDKPCFTYALVYSGWFFYDVL
jgi:hypothetical protein